MHRYVTFVGRRKACFVHQVKKTHARKPEALHVAYRQPVLLFYLVRCWLTRILSETPSRIGLAVMDGRFVSFNANVRVDDRKAGAGLRDVLDEGEDVGHV